MPRLPDFILIGAMKAGTTTLFRRLEEVDGIELPRIKEPHFFSHDENWDRGQSWYEALFDGCDGIVGEASASYSDSAHVHVTAERMASVLPGVRILYAVRNPVERMRSHYRHQVLRARESRPFPVALQDPDNEYLSCSLYAKVLSAYLRVFPEEQLLVYRLEELDATDSRTWSEILAHIGANQTPMPPELHNVSSEKRQFTRPLLWLWERGIEPPRSLPRSIRRAGKAILTQRASHDRGLLATADDPIPESVLAKLHRDAQGLHGLALDFEV